MNTWKQTLTESRDKQLLSLNIVSKRLDEALHRPTWRVTSTRRVRKSSVRDEADWHCACSKPRKVESGSINTLYIAGLVTCCIQTYLILDLERLFAYTGSFRFVQ